MNEEKLNAFMGQLIADFGGAFSVSLVRMGASLGLYKAMQNAGPMTSQELAAATGLAERYVREWLAHHAASHYLAYNATTKTFSLLEEQVMVFADENSPYYMIGAFDAAAAYMENQPMVEKAFRTGAGVGWENQSACLSCAIARFFRPGYQANLVQQWLPALSGVVEKLERGAKVADVGCGHGHSTVIMAEAFPNSEFIGFDFHAESIAAAEQHAMQHPDVSNVRFDVGLAKSFPGENYDLVTFFDCLHDMGDPVGAATHVKQSLARDGTWMIVEPLANDGLEYNLNPISRLYYAASTMVCVPTSLNQEVGAALGAQAGQSRLREVIVENGGFSRLRRAAQTPFNMVLEAHP